VKWRHHMEVLVGSVLLVGVLASMALIATGMVWHRIVSGGFEFDYRLARTTVFGFVDEDVRDLLAGVWRPRLLVNLGIAVLLLTPYVRVLTSMAYFALVEYDWKYTGFTAVVLATLTWSLFWR
jgi:uncharacterized membrane protein